MNGRKTLLDGIRRVATPAIQNRRFLLARSTASPCQCPRCSPQRILQQGYRGLLRGRNDSRWLSTASTSCSTAEKQHLPSQLAVNWTATATASTTDHGSDESPLPRNSTETASARRGEASPRDENVEKHSRNDMYDEETDGKAEEDEQPAAKHASQTDHRDSRANSTRGKKEKPLLPSSLETTELYALLEQEAAKGQLEKVEIILGTLVRTRHERPNQQIYSALVLVNIDPSTGSAAKLSSILDEMREEQFGIDPVICHNALKVLAVHPDFALRAQILEDMRNRWISLSEEGWHDVVAGYAREGLFEQALEGLETMERDKVMVADWLYDTIVYLMCQVDEIDEALSIMQRRITLGASARSCENAWYQLFDRACAALHFEAISFIWARCVRLLYLNPSSGQCMCVLNAAARAGDVDLATDVFRVLTERKSVLDSLHYELLIEAYTNADDISTALTLLCVMNASKIRVSLASTTAIIRYLAKSPSRPGEALQVLRTLSQSRRLPEGSVGSVSNKDSGGMPERAGPPLIVPVAAMNALLQATIQVSGINPAIEFYKELHAICAEGPDLETFNLLIRGCHMAQRKDTAMFLVSEMVALGVAPDALTYDRLIILCLECAGETGDYEDAFRYYREMRSQQMAPRKGTLLYLLKFFMKRGDERWKKFLRLIRRLDYGDREARAWIISNFPRPRTEDEADDEADDDDDDDEPMQEASPAKSAEPSR